MGIEWEWSHGISETWMFTQWGFPESHWFPIKHHQFWIQFWMLPNFVMLSSYIDLKKTVPNDAPLSLFWLPWFWESPILGNTQTDVMGLIQYFPNHWLNIGDTKQAVPLRNTTIHHWILGCSNFKEPPWVRSELIRGLEAIWILKDIELDATWMNLANLSWV